MVNNAIVAGPHSKGLLETTEEDWDAIMAVGLRGVFLCCKRAVQQMLGQEPVAEARGRIINLSSQHGMIGAPGHVAYCTAKGGVVNLTRQVAVDFGPRGIIVNAIAPGKILTRPADEPDSPEVLAYSHARTPFARLGRPDDVAAAAVFLASDECTLRERDEPARRRRLDGLLMRAAVIHELGATPVVEERDEPVAGRRARRWSRRAAAGLNPVDLAIGGGRLLRRPPAAAVRGRPRGRRPGPRGLGVRAGHARRDAQDRERLLRRAVRRRRVGAVGDPRRRRPGRRRGARHRRRWPGWLAVAERGRIRREIGCSCWVRPARSARSRCRRPGCSARPGSWRPGATLSGWSGRGSSAPTRVVALAAATSRRRSAARSRTAARTW